MLYQNAFFKTRFEAGSLAELTYRGLPLLGDGPTIPAFELQVDKDFRDHPINFGKTGIQKRGGLTIPGKWCQGTSRNPDSPQRNRVLSTIVPGGVLKNEVFRGAHHSKSSDLAKSETRLEGNTVHTRTRIGAFEVHVRYAFSDSQPSVEITPEIICRQKGAGAVNQARLNFGPFVSSDPEDFFEIFDPKNGLRNLRKPFTDMDPEPNTLTKDLLRYESMDKCTAQEVSLAVHRHSNARGLNIFLWGHAIDNIPLFYTYDLAKKVLRYSQHWLPFAPLTQGQRIKLSPIKLGVHEGSWIELLKQVSFEKRRSGWTAPSQDQNLEGAVIYQVHGFVYDFGGFRSLIKSLKHLRSLGVSILYLPPLFPPEAYLNDIAAGILPALGSRADLRALAKACHTLGIRVIVDFVLHNIYYRSSFISKNPDWLRRDAKGKACFEFPGGQVTETRDRSFRKFIVGYLDRLVRETGVDGFRFDVAGKQPPGFNLVNGEKEIPGAGIFSQTSLLQDLKKRLDRHKKCIYLEEGYGVLGFRYVNHGWINFLKEGKKAILLGDEKAVSEWIRNLSVFFTDAILKNRANVATMLHVRIHDTALIGPNLGRVLEPADLPFLFLVWTAKGVAFLLHGLERGRERLLQELGRLRRLPVFAKGQMIFDLGRVPDSVLAFRRTDGKKTAYVFINFSLKEKSIFFDAPESVKLWYDPLEENSLENGKFFSGERSFQLKPCGMTIFLNHDSPSLVRASPATKTKVIHPLSESFTGERLDLLWVQKEQALKENDVDFSETSLGGVNAKISGWRADPHSDSKLDPRLLGKIPPMEWQSVFLPTLRRPFEVPATSETSKWIEGVLPGEFMWNRHPLAGKPQVFRRDFVVAASPDRAEFSVSSPAAYDFDRCLKTEWAYAEAARFNTCEAFLNGKQIAFVKTDGFLRPREVSRFLVRGNNTLLIVVKPKEGSRGIYARLTLEKGKNQSVLVSDNTWLSLPLDREDFAVSEEMFSRRAGSVEKKRISGAWQISLPTRAPEKKCWRYAVDLPGIKAWELTRGQRIILSGSIVPGVDWRSPYSGEPFAYYDSMVQPFSQGHELRLSKKSGGHENFLLDSFRRVRLEASGTSRGARFLAWFK